MKTILLLFISTISIIIISCNKNDTYVSPPLNSAIYGTWKGTYALNETQLQQTSNDFRYWYNKDLTFYQFQYGADLTFNSNGTGHLATSTDRIFTANETFDLPLTIPNIEAPIQSGDSVVRNYTSNMSFIFNGDAYTVAMQASSNQILTDSVYIYDGTQDSIVGGTYSYPQNQIVPNTLYSGYSINPTGTQMYINLPIAGSTVQLLMTKQ